MGPAWEVTQLAQPMLQAWCMQWCTSTVFRTPRSGPRVTTGRSELQLWMGSTAVALTQLLAESIASAVRCVCLCTGGIGAALGAAAGYGSHSGRSHSVLVMEPLTMIGGMGAAGGVGLMNQGAGAAGCTGLCQVRDCLLPCGQGFMTMLHSADHCYSGGLVCAHPPHDSDLLFFCVLFFHHLPPPPPSLLVVRKVWGKLNAGHYPGGSALNLFPDMFVAEQSFWTMLNGSESVTTAPGCRLVGVDKLGTCVTQAQFLCAQDGVPVTVQASVFIDASYDGV